MTSLRVALVYLVAAGAVVALPAQDAAGSNAVDAECAGKDCVRHKLLAFVDHLLAQRDAITLTDGVHLVKSEGGEPAGAPRALDVDADAGGSLEAALVGRVARFLDAHTLQVDVRGSEIVAAVSGAARSFSDALDEEDIADGVEEARGKKKKAQKLMGPLMAAAALKMAILGKLALAAIALIAGKALLIGKLALVLSAVIGLKKLLGGQGKHVTYEVVSHPQHSAAHSASHEAVYGGGGGGISGGGGGYVGDVGGGSSGHGGWGRSLEPQQQLAYRAHPQP